MLSPKPELERIGGRLRISRNQLGFSQASLAKKLGLSTQAYNAYEAGKRALPILVLTQLCRDFELDADWLLFGTNHEARDGFELSLNKYLEDENIRISNPKRQAIVDNWYKSLKEGKEVPIEDLHTWIEIMRE